jgi:hypothetical protein
LDGWGRDLEEQEKGRRRVGMESRVCGREKLGAGNKVVWFLGEPLRLLELPDSTGSSVVVEIEEKDRIEQRNGLCGSRSRS